MNESVKCKKHSGYFLDGIKSVLSSDYFPFFTAAVSLISYYLGADLVNIYIFAIVLIAMIMLLDDLTPLFTQFLFLAVIASKTNSPMYGASDYYTTPSVFIQIACLIALIAIAALYRIIKQARGKKFHVSLVFVSVCLLSAAYILNGVFSEEHASDDLLYGVILAATLLPLYALLSCTVTVNEKNINKVCTGFFIFSLVLVVEVAVTILQSGLTVESLNLGTVRNFMKFGWGMWNNAGMLLVICIAPVMYLSLKRRGGALYVVWATIICFAVIATTSRQSYLGALMAFGISGVYMFVKSRGRNSNRVAFVLMIIIWLALFILLAYHYGDDIINILKFGLFDSDGEYSASGRMDLITIAWENFLKSPLFGVGFYADNTADIYYTSMSWFPHFYHNTIAQVMASCGIAGLLVYVFHRIVTVIAFFKTRSTGKFFVGISMLAYLVMGLFDNHMYYILSAFIYPAFIAVLTNPAQKEEQEVAAAVEEDEPAGYRKGVDAFLDGLTFDERREFFETFINCENKIAGIGGYEIGGDNGQFFKRCFIYLGAVSGVSDGLMNKIFLAVQKYN